MTHTTRRLATFTGRGYDKGRGTLQCAAWALVAEPLQRSVLCPPSVRTRILRAFGAQIGEGTLIRHDVRIHWPWKLAVGENSWIGVGAWLLNLEPITIGSDVCVSQGDPCAVVGATALVTRDVPAGARVLAPVATKA